MNYNRNGSIPQNHGESKQSEGQRQARGSQGSNAAYDSSEIPAGETPIQVNGFEQVLSMLKVADAEFRESLLRRLAQRDPELARNLRADLREMGI